ncbi:MAG: M1 family metallopeptidase [Thermoplasmata archaeon]
MRSSARGKGITLLDSLDALVLEYDLALDIDLDRGAFHGTVEVSGYPEMDPVELDSVDLSIESVHCRDVPVLYRSDLERGKLILSPPSPRGGPLRVSFSGRAGEGVQTGLFVSRLGAHRALSTQMEPEGCRRLLPCFDRPDMKGVFRVQITTAREWQVISNMPGASRSLSDGRREWKFAPTPAMSSYLLYLGVGPFEETTDGLSEPRLIVAGPPGSGRRAQRALSVARATLRTLGEYFDLPFPLPKMHLVACSDFWVAMENWGAISGGENHYLFDERTPPAALRFAEQTVVHELAHQWFGDLVTMQTWDDLWLNEAFATFITPRVQERAGLRADPWGEFVLFTARGDPVDSLRSTHPVKPEAVAAREIMASADFITYFKGSRLLRMIEAFVGEEAFRRGLSRYLRRHQFGNARSDDLWSALGESSTHDVVAVMQRWVERPGLPCIAVAQVGPDIELTQRRFTYLPGTPPEGPWPIPLTLEEGGRRESLLFDTARIRLPGRDARTLRLDPGRAGFFRILYAPSLRAHFIGRLEALPPLDRWGFLHDARAFLLSGDYSLEEYLQTMRAARDSTDLVSVEEVTQSLHLFGACLIDLPRFRESAREFCRAQLERLGEASVPGEPATDDTLREWLAWKRVPVDEEYSRVLAARFASIDREPPWIRPAVTTAYGRWAAPAALDRLLERAVSPESESATQACEAIECFPTSEMVWRALDRGFGSVRLGDLFLHLIWSAARNPVGRAALWDWLPAHLRELERRSQGTYLFSLTLDFILPLVGLGREEAVRQYFAAERFPEGAIGIRTGLETLEAVSRMRARIGAG